MGILSVCEAVDIQVEPVEKWLRIAPVWAELFNASTRFSFFLSEDWVNTWMEVFGAMLQPRILLFSSGGEAEGACLLVERRRRWPLPVRRIFLNATGEDACEATYPEYNDLLCKPGTERAVARKLAEYLRSCEWDELRLEGFQPGPGYEALRKELADFGWEEGWRPSFSVDLAGIRKSHGQFEASLGKATRKHLRQSRRHFSGETALAVEEPGDVDEALSMFEEMAEFNRIRHGGRSVFFSERFVEFHRRLIARCIPGRRVRLMKVRGSGRTLGTVYLFVRRGRVYFYQCGFDFGDHSKRSPGTVTVAACVQQCLEAGFDEFDFLAGGASYKERLTTGLRPMVWASASRPGVKRQVLSCLRRLKSLGERRLRESA